MGLFINKSGSPGKALNSARPCHEPVEFTQGFKAVQESLRELPEPPLERSADSFVREWIETGSRGHGCPRSEPRFMGRAKRRHSC